VIIFDKFGDGQSERNCAAPVFPVLGQGAERVDLLHSRRLTSASLSTCPSSPFSTFSDTDRVPATNRGVDRLDIFHSRCFDRASLRLPVLNLISNRELGLLERPLSHCKQRKATVSNRELSTVCDSTGIATSNSSQVSESPSSAAISDPNSRKLTTFLTGSASQTEFVVTHSRQTTGEFLTGARNAFKVVQIRAEFRNKSQALREKECRSRDAAEQGKLPLHIRNEKELL
jgi:hypothetical protein